MEPPSTLIRVNGRKGIGIGVSTAPDYDVVKAGEAVRLKLAQLEEQMPVGIEMVTLYPEDQGTGRFHISFFNHSNIS